MCMLISLLGFVIFACVEFKIIILHNWTNRVFYMYVEVVAIMNVVAIMYVPCKINDSNCISNLNDGAYVASLVS